MFVFLCRTENPKRIGEAFIIGETFIKNENVALILGDNLFHGSKQLKQFATNDYFVGGQIFAYRVKDPQRYGVVEFDENNQVIGLEEKPNNQNHLLLFLGYIYMTGPL